MEEACSSPSTEGLSAIPMPGQKKGPLTYMIEFMSYFGNSPLQGGECRFRLSDARLQPVNKKTRQISPGLFLYKGITLGF